MHLPPATIKINFALIPWLGENHGKNRLLCTDFLIGHILQSFAGESGNKSSLKTGD